MTKLPKEILLQNAATLEKRIAKNQQQIILDQQKLEVIRQKLAETENKTLVKQAAAKNEENKINKTLQIPASKKSMAILSVKVAENWATKYPNLQIPELQQTDLYNSANQLSIFISESVRVVDSKKTNTMNLQAVNKQIDAAVSQLKNDLQVIHPKNTLDSVYQNYGLDKGAKNYYTLTQDNSFRVTQLLKLVQKLQERGNPVMQLPTYNLQNWFNLQQEQARLWQESESLREQRSILVANINNKYTIVKENVRQLHSYLAFAYSKNDIKAHRRNMGFLKESF